jgi:hypothetical protein
MKMQKVEKWHLMYRYFNQYDANGRVWSEILWNTTTVMHMNAIFVNKK